MKYKVLIVDDDLNFVEQIQDMVDWEQNGLQIVDIEVLGIAGLGKFFTYEPDILLLSESVYIMSGEEFLHLIQKARHSYRVIYMTRQSVSNLNFPQVCTCVDKTILTKTKLLETLLFAISELEKERTIVESCYRSPVEQRILNEKRQKELSSLFQDISTYQFEHLRIQLGLRIHDTDLVLVTTRVPVEDQKRQSVIRSIAEALEQYGNGEQFSLDEDIYGILFNLPVGNVIHQNKVLEQMLGRLSQGIIDRKLPGCKLYVGNSTHIMGLTAELKALLELMRYDYFTADQHIIRKKLLIAVDYPAQEFMMEQLCKEIQYSIRTSQHTKLSQSLETLFLSLLKHSMSIPLQSAIRKKCMAIYDLTVNTLSNSSKRLQTPDNFLCVEDEYQWYSEHFLQLLDRIALEKEHTHGCVLYAQEYILQHYQEGISLESVSKKIGVSKSYLCSLFKKDLSVGFTNYLNLIRISKAKELLTARESVKTTAVTVGYSDPKYFSRIFKGVTGQTPKEFQKLVDGIKELTQANESSLLH